MHDYIENRSITRMLQIQVLLLNLAALKDNQMSSIIDLLYSFHTHNGQQKMN